MLADSLEEGRCREIRDFLTEQGTSYFWDFYEDEVKDSQRDKAQTWKWIQHLANVPKIINKDKFRHLEDSIWELKPTLQIRYPGFFYGKVEEVWQRNYFIITHGFKKQTQETPRREIERAIQSLRRFMSNQEEGSNEC